MEEMLARIGRTKVKEAKLLADLPDGCWTCVFRHLRSREDRVAVCLTCRLWCSLEGLSRHTLRFYHYYDAEVLQEFLMSAPRRFPHIFSITIFNLDLFDSFFQIFKTSYFAKLTNIHVERCFEITDTTVDYLIAGCPELSQLSLRFCVDISDVSLHAIARAIPRLEYLDVTHCTVTDTGIDDVLKSCPNMKEILFSYCVEVEGWGLRHGTNLKKVQAEGCRFTDAGLAEGLRGATSIQVFNMSHLKCGDHLWAVGLGQVVASCHMMQVLCLWRCGVLDDATVSKIAQGCINLKGWDLSCSAEVTFEGWQAVGRYCTRLQYLDVSASQHFCDRSMLAILENCPSLCYISVSQRSLSGNPRSLFQSYLPRVDIEICGFYVHSKMCLG